RPPEPGDLVCQTCGAGNKPDRKFCRLCGASLVAAPVERRPSWWRRLLGRRRRPVAAGERPMRARARRASTARRIVKTLILLAVLAGLVALALNDTVQSRLGELVDKVRGQAAARSDVAVSSETRQLDRMTTFSC
ncbi:MAG: zinc ribbon domain-containing protein, partial [Actinomycetota bacterium]